MKSSLGQQKSSNIQQNFDAKNKIQKIYMYINNANKQLPLIDDKCSGKELAQQMKFFFQDNNLVIAYQQTSILNEDYFQGKIQELYQAFIKQTNSNKQQISFINFIKFWVQKDQKLKIYYQPYDQVRKNAVSQVQKDQSSQKTIKIDKKIVQTQNSQNLKQQKTVKLKPQKKSSLKILNNVTIELKQKIKNKEKKQQNYNLNNVKQHLNTIHDHYSRKCLNVPKALSFDNLNQIFHTMNLTQFMSFVKDVGIINYNVLNQKQLSEKQTPIKNQIKKQKVQTLSKTSKREKLLNTYNLQYKANLTKRCQKLNLNFFKSMFQKHSKQFLLTAQQFFQTIIDILKFVYEKEEINLPEEFQLFHLNSQCQYKKYAKSIGIYFPIYNVTFLKPGQTKKYKYNLPKIKSLRGKFNTCNNISISRQTLSGSNSGSKSILKQNSITKVLMFKSRLEKKQYQIMGKMSLVNLKKFKLSQKQQASLIQYIGHKQPKIKKNSTIINKQPNFLTKKSVHQEKNSHTLINRKNNGLLDRIDSRINSVINKIR